MSEIPPIACTLSGSELPQRHAEIRALGRDGLVSTALEEGRAVLRFRPDSTVRERVAAVVAAERDCCAFLEFDLAESPDATVLTIAAPNGGEAVVHELADLFAGR